MESQELKDQTYVDDELVAAADKNQAYDKTRRLDEICSHAGMPNKGWTYSGDDNVEDVSIGGEEIGATEKVLGVSWVPSRMHSVSMSLYPLVTSKEIQVMQIMLCTFLVTMNYVIFPLLC